jgi:hypothetical protein
MVADDVDRDLAIGGGEQLDPVVLELLEGLLDEQPDVLFVVDDQDRGHEHLVERT